MEDKKEYTLTEKIQFFEQELALAIAKEISAKRRIERLHKILEKLKTAAGQ